MEGPVLRRVAHGHRRGDHANPSPVHVYDVRSVDEGPGGAHLNSLPEGVGPFNFRQEAEFHRRDCEFDGGGHSENHGSDPVHESSVGSPNPDRDRGLLPVGPFGAFEFGRIGGHSDVVPF